MNDLTKIRKNKGLTVNQMAQTLGVSKGHYSHLENGTREISEAIKPRLAEALGISLDELNSTLRDITQFTKAVNNWIWKIRVNGKSAAEAYRKDLKFLTSRGSDQDNINYFIKFIEYNIGNSIREELANDILLEEYLLRKIR